MKENREDQSAVEYRYEEEVEVDVSRLLQRAGEMEAQAAHKEWRARPTLDDTNCVALA